MTNLSSMPSHASQPSRTPTWSASWRHLDSDPLDMNGKRMKKRNWRGVSDKVAKDKAEIYILSPLIRGGYKAGII